MLSQKEVGVLYETLLTAPGMEATIKLSLQLSRKTVLFLNRAITQGITTKEQAEGMLRMMDEEMSAQLSDVGKMLLEKAGLTEMNNRLNILQAK
ncbi:MAG: hypothetical protein EPN39_04355 [Chitinophagaceae bacterium]|nr:MAG: hypothetical protein EPN39_04355 [Chitinophagaceae bacterium]